MKQYDVLEFPTGRKQGMPFVIVLQTGGLGVFKSCIVAPLMKADSESPIGKLSIPIRINQLDHYILMHELASVPLKRFGKRVGTGDHLHVEVMSAVDFLFAGI